MKLADYLYEEQERTPGVCTLMRPHITVVVFRCTADSVSEANERTTRLTEAIRQDGRINPISAVIDGYNHIRIVVCFH